MITAEEVRAIMEEQGVSAYRMAKDLNISESTISFWTSGRTKELRPSVLEKILDYLGYELVVRKKRRR